MHNGFVNMSQEKMSKSLGNVVTVHQLLEDWPGEVLRYLLLSAHYRKPLDWSDDALAQARRTLDRMYAVLREAAARAGPLQSADAPGEAFLAALDDDLRTPDALAEMNGLARRLGNAEDEQEIRDLAAELLADGELIGLLQDDPEAWFKAGGDAAGDAAIDALVAEREQARANRDFARADEIRDQLAGLGIALEDSPEGTRWRRE